MKTLYLHLFFVGFILSCVQAKPKNRLVLMVLLDGFRYDYIDKYANPNGILRNLSQNGVKSWSKSIFPSNTYPNHYTIVTGQYAEAHGIVNNDVYDSLNGHHYRMGYTDESNVTDWFQAEPVWIKNEKVNGKAFDKHSVVYDWPGATAFFDDYRAYSHRAVSYEYENLSSCNATIDSFVNAIKPEKINLAILSIAEPDTVGHYSGPNSPELANTIKELDYVLLRLFNKLATEKGYDVENDIEFLLVADHGMANLKKKTTSPDRTFVYLDDYLDLDKCFTNISSYSTTTELWFKNDSDINPVYKVLKQVQRKEWRKIQGVYLKHQLPNHWEIKNNSRIAPIMIVARQGYLAVDIRNNELPWSDANIVGNHGYDPSYKEMRGIFVANGPAFKKQYKTKRLIHLVDIYELLCYLLDLKPNKNGGKFNRIKHILQ